jgi:hypothetical protein
MNIQEWSNQIIKGTMSLPTNAFYKNPVKKTGVIPPIHTCTLLLEFSSLKHLHLYPSLDSYYYYVEEKGFYKKLYADDVSYRAYPFPGKVT